MLNHIISGYYLICDYINSLINSAFVLYNVDDGEFVVNENGEQNCEIYSIGKVISSMVVIDVFRDLNSEIEVQEDDVISEMYVKAGSKYSIYDLLCSALIRSDNNAINCLVNQVGSDAFRCLVDKKLLQINMCETYSSQTSYTGMVSTANDLVLMMEYLVRHYPILVEILSKREYFIQDRNNHKKDYFSSTTNFERLKNVCFGKTGTWNYRANYTGYLRMGGG